MFKILTLEELIKELDKYKHAELHVHHTWKPTHKSFNGSNHIELQENMENYHINTKHYKYIAQHVTLMPDGKFVTGRDFGLAPASMTGHNSILGIPAFAVEMVGNFDVEGKQGTEVNELGYDKLEGEQLKSIIGLAKYFDSKGRYIRFHREASTKTCPGNGIDKTEFMKLVKAPVLSSWEKEMLDAKEFVMFNGISDGTNPKDNMTREMMWVMLYRMSKRGL